MTITIRTAKVGEGHVAVTQLGGILVRGKRATGSSAEAVAVRNLLWKLAGEGGDDESLLALELELAGTNLEAEFRGTEKENRRALPDPTAAEKEEVAGNWPPWPDDGESKPAGS